VAESARRWLPFLDGVYGPGRDGKGLMFHPAPAPSQQDIEQLVERVSKRILRFLQRRGVITLVTAPGDGEVTASLPRCRSIRKSVAVAQAASRA
jgi:hypothetical protein